MAKGAKKATSRFVLCPDCELKLLASSLMLDSSKYEGIVSGRDPERNQKRRDRWIQSAIPHGPIFYPVQLQTGGSLVEHGFDLGQIEGLLQEADEFLELLPPLDESSRSVVLSQKTPPESGDEEENSGGMSTIAHLHAS